jgi:hypothetical protein
MMIPARISCIVAREAPVVAVFRRGPSKQVALLDWNLVTNRVELGQWLKGRIYERRADLSPDGRHLIYFAGDHHWTSDPTDLLQGTWTAISRMPYLRAMHLYGWGHSWNGGGLFIDNTNYWLNDAGPMGYLSVGRIECGLRISSTPPAGVTPAMGEDAVTYFPRLLRDGWVKAEQSTHRKGEGEYDIQSDVFRKTVRPEWVLEKTFQAGVYAGPLGEPYHEMHRLIGPQGAVTFTAEWADVWKHELLFATGGCLLRQAVHAKGLGDVVRVADLNDMRFKALEAPFAGVGPGDLRVPA